MTPDLERAAAQLSKRGLKPITTLAANKEHGDRLRYMAGCRCAECRGANTAYERARQQARKNGDWNGIVPANKARAHMLKLSAQGCGRRAVQAVTDISDTVLSDIRSRRKKNIRARTERLILAVTKDMASDNALTPAAGTWKLINKLLDKGYTKIQLAQMLDPKARALQIRTEHILVITACAISRIYQKLEATGFAGAKKHKPVEVLPKNCHRPKPGVLIHSLPF